MAKAKRLKHLKWNSSLGEVGSAIAGEFGEAARALSGPAKRRKPTRRAKPGARHGAYKRGPARKTLKHYLRVVKGENDYTYRGVKIRVRGGRKHYTATIMQARGGGLRGMAHAKSFRAPTPGSAFKLAMTHVDEMQGAGSAKRRPAARRRYGSVAVSGRGTGYLHGRPRRASVPIGGRVELSPSTDAWMMGDRFGVITGVTKEGLVKVKMDRSGKVRKMRRSDVMPAARGTDGRRL